MSYSKKDLWILSLLFLVALAIRLIAVDSLAITPDKDALEYESIALNLISGHGYSLDGEHLTTLRPPLYPLFIASIYSLFGTDFHYVLVAQSILNAALLFPLFWLALYVCGSKWVAWLSCSLLALHTSFENVANVFAENLITPLLLFFTIFMGVIYAAPKHQYRFALAAGLMAGLMGLAKPEYFMFGAAAALGGLLLPGNRSYWRMWFVVAVVSLLMVGGWQFRNALVVDAGQQSRAQYGLVFANCPALIGDGWWAVTDMQVLELQREACNQKLGGQDVGPLLGKVKEMWLNQPAVMAKLVVNRILILWASPPVGTTALAEKSEMLRWLLLVLQYFFVGTAVVCLMRFGLAEPKLYPFILSFVYLSSVYGAIHAIRRYGYPFVPELCIVFAYALWLLYKRFRKPAEGGLDDQT